MEKLGRYQLIEIIGEGAMARVYKAYDPEINRGIAVKLLKTQLAADANYRARFLREAKGAGILSHPNIVTIYDVGVDDDRPYIAEELVEGMTLADLMRSGKELSTQEIVEIGIQLARALDYAHRRGIIHRDVKPGNIMLVANTTQVKVADFGICRIDKGDSAELTQATALGDVIGTPNYMSPEQVMGQKVDARSDLYSVGRRPLQAGHRRAAVRGRLDHHRRGEDRADRGADDRQAERRRAVVAAPGHRAVAPQAAREALPDRRGDGAGARERRPRAAGGRGAQGGGTPDSARRALGVDHGDDGRADDERDGDDPLSAPVPGDDEPGDGIRRVAGEIHGVAKRRAAARRGLGRDRGVHPGDDDAGRAFPYLVVVDDEGDGPREQRCGEARREVRAAWRRSRSRTPDKSIAVQQFTDADTRKVLDFGAPILFQGKKIGDVHLGIFEEPLSRVARLILALLAILTLVTIAAVAVGTYLLARRLIAPLRKVKSGLDELGARPLRRAHRREARRRARRSVRRVRSRSRGARGAVRPAPARAADEGEGTLIVQAPKTAGTPLPS